MEQNEGSMYEIHKELAAAQYEDKALKKQLEVAKQNFIDSIVGGLGDDIRMNVNLTQKPIPLKKPFKVKVQEFFNKLGKVFGL